jgi:queuine tRNA-ribosyltransferase
MLRPGPEVFKRLGGIQKMMNWPGSVLTDSGGFQIFSLAHQRTMSEEGATFRSHVDGEKILLTPERSIGMQQAIGSDIMMVLDQCVPGTVDAGVARDAMELTHRWAERSFAARGEGRQALFGIVQGAVYPELRKASAAAVTGIDFDGFAIGGLAVGEGREIREDMTAHTAALLPRDKPRYLMGVGTPLDLLEGVHRGVDMFDCIIPAAHSQQGVAYTSRGRLRLGRGVFKFADEPIDPACDCYACGKFTKGYVHHLHKAGESFGWNLTAIHNLRFYHRLMGTMRAHILAGTFAAYYREQREALAT